MIFPWSGPVRVFRNDLSHGAGAAWLRVFLDRGDATDIAPDGIGCVISATVGADTWIGRIDGGSNYLSQSEMSAHFGLGAGTTIDTLDVAWTNGDVTTLTDVDVNQTITIAHGATPCTGDVNGDGSVAVADLLAVLNDWSACAGCDTDINGDDAVNVTDLLAVLNAFGPCR